ncbi:hypothetical protein RHOFW510R12_00445 [Rhodanobacter sp. FW510-R12]
MRAGTSAATPWVLNALRGTACVALLLLSPWTRAHEASALIDVRIERNGEPVERASVAAMMGKAAVVEATRSFDVDVAACVGTGAGGRYQEGGHGKAGVTVAVTPVADGHDMLQVSVSLASAEVARMVPIQSGPCRGQTPAMIKFDAKAGLNLRPGQPQRWQVGEYEVTVELRALRHASGTAAGDLSA